MHNGHETMALNRFCSDLQGGGNTSAENKVDQGGQEAHHHQEEEKGGGGKSGIATKIAVFVNNLPGKQTRLHPQSESKVPSHEAQQRRDFFLSVP